MNSPTVAITRSQIRQAARISLEGVERLVIANGGRLPPFPRHWSGYRRAVIKRAERIVGAVPEREVWRKS